MFHSDIFHDILNASEEMVSVSSEVPVVAAIAIEGKVVSFSSNRVEIDNSALLHAEFICIAKALQVLNRKYLEHASLYVTLEPCPFCAAALEKVRIKDIFFGAYDVKSGGIFHGPRIFDHSNHKPNIIGGLEELRCQSVLQSFFKKLRNF